MIKPCVLTRGLRGVSIVGLLAVFSAGTASSQAVNATLVGTVSDVGGGLVPSAKVVVTETNTGIVRTLKTNDSGNYTLADLPPGTYSVMIEHTGFKKEERKDVSVLVDSKTRVDFQLQPGSMTETVEVNIVMPQLQTDRADTGRTIDQQIIEEMPMGVNRNFQTLLDLVPGTAPETFQHSQFFNASSSLQTNVNGQPRMGNNLQVEGIDNNQRTGLLQILIPPAEALQSVSISVTNHDPELGRATGAVTNITLKSGTNRWHGSAYEFLQNSAFDARSFFNPSIGHIAYNYLGGTIGGPIRHNKIFFFTDYLRVMDHEANTNQVTIPSAAFRTGDLSADTHQVFDPATGNPLTGVGRTPFPGNIIPTARINSVSAAVLALIPNPNEPFNPAAPSNNYFALLPAQKTNNEVDAKVDWNITDKDRLSGRFSFARPVIYQAPIFGDAGGPAQGAFQGSGTQKTYSTGLNYNRVVSPTLITEVRIGVAHYHNEAQQTDYGKNDSTNIGIPGVNLGPFTSGFVGINIGGAFSTPITGYSPSLPWDRAEANIDIVNSWTKIVRNHTIKWGLDVRRIRDDLLQDQTYSPRGIIYFGTNQTSAPGSSTGNANDMASFLLDVPYQEGRDVNTYFPALRQWQVFGYGADNWQVSPKLTLSFGVRWEYYKPPTPAFPGGFSNYDFVNNTLTLAGIGGHPLDMGLKSQYKYFAPRLGVAYRLTSKTVIRTGFGISYTPFPDNTWAYNFPVRANNLYTSNGNSYAVAVLPGGLPPTFQNGFPAPDPVVVPSSGVITNPNPTQAEFVIPLNYRNGYVECWNFAIQQALPWQFVLDVAYVGNHGVDTPAAVNLNAGQIIGAGNKGQPLYPTTASVTQYFQGFSSTYNSLQVKFDRRFSSGFRLITAFTWQKAMDFQGGDDGGLAFYAGQGLSRNYARADFDRTLNFVQSYIYDLPFGQGRRFLSHSLAGKIVGGWSLATILSWRTGSPLTFTENNTLSLGSGGTATADQVAPISYLGGINIGNPWFSKTSFAQSPNGVQGNTGRNIYSGPDLFAINSNLSRTILFNEGRIRTQLRLESFNVTNTAQFSNPNTTVGNSNFGYITGTIGSGTGVNGTGGGRSVQLGVKVVF